MNYPVVPSSPASYSHLPALAHVQQCSLLPQETINSINLLLHNCLGHSSTCSSIPSQTRSDARRSNCLHATIYEIMCGLLLTPSLEAPSRRMSSISFSLLPNFPLCLRHLLKQQKDRNAIFSITIQHGAPSERRREVTGPLRPSLQKTTRGRANWASLIGKIRSIVRLLKEPSGEKPVEDIQSVQIPRPTHMHESRWLERIDHLNRNGGDLEKQWKRWAEPGRIFADEKEKRYFFTWLARQPGNKAIPPVRYLRPVDRPFCKLIVKDGVCSNLINGVLHTLDDDQPHIFAWTTNLSILIDVYNRGFSHHSCVVSGAPVLAAGEMIFSKKGILKRMTDKSGHYRTTRDPFIEFVYYLSKKGINMKNVKIALDCVKEPYTTENDFSGEALLELRKKRLAQKMDEKKT